MSKHPKYGNAVPLNGPHQHMKLEPEDGISYLMEDWKGVVRKNNLDFTKYVVQFNTIEYVHFTSKIIIVSYTATHIEDMPENGEEVGDEASSPNQ